MTDDQKKALLETILNDLDITFEDEMLKKKIARNMNSGIAYLEDKFGMEIDFEKDQIALDLLISYCRYGRSNAIEQFSHDFKTDLTAFALRGAITRAKAEQGAQDESKV